MKLQKTLSRILDGLILLVFILFFSSAGFQDRNTSGWYQQWFPNLNGSTIKDMTFLDSLTGFAVTNTNSSLQAYILKTTNGGDNWLINYTYSQSNTNWYFVKIGFVDSNTGYAFGWSEMFKTTNGGNNWNIFINGLYANDVELINKDTMVAVLSNGFDGGVYRSTNGGINWTRNWTNGTSGNPSKIYMYDKNLGFSCTDNAISTIFYRTTNGGLNWTNLNDSSFSGIQFYDSLIGWKQTSSGVKKTIDGGLTWVRQNTPVFFDNRFMDLSLVNKDTLWYVGPAILRYNRGWGVICKSTNGGISWGYQLPDTSIKISNYSHIDFINKYNGWAYKYTTTGVHTKVGGNDTSIFTNINITNTEITDFRLFQNYPNPFNPRTVVSCQLSVVSNVSIKVYDVQGHEVQTLLQGKLNPGVYEYFFNGNNLSSGIYFYSMIIDGKVFDTKKMLMIK